MRQGNICERRKQHARDIKNRKTTNDFYEHSRGKVGHKPDWSGTVFVAKEKHWRARKIKEAILINALNPTKNVRNKGILNLEKGYEMDPYGVASMGYSDRYWMVKFQKISSICFRSFCFVCILCVHVLW